MKRLEWLTDIHLNFLEDPVCQGFLDSVAAEKPDGVIISGDIAEGHTIEAYLRTITGRLTLPGSATSECSGRLSRSQFEACFMRVWGLGPFGSKRAWI